MVVYADTSFLVTLYVIQPDTNRAVAHLQREKASLSFTPFHRQELRNAIRLCVFREYITNDQCRHVLREVDIDLAEGILAHTPLPWTETLQKAEELGASHTESMGVRSLDILHVASALALKATIFLTLDSRQRALADAAGLKTRW
jgi:predicted nucleic acid-binding protein